MDDLLTTEEVALLLRKTPSTMRYLRYVGAGPRSFKLGRRVLYRRCDVEAYIDQEYSASEGRS